MFKAPIQELSERFGGSPMSPQLNPEKIARDFGRAYEIGPLPESDHPVGHVEDDVDTRLLLDNKKTPTEKHEPIPLIVLATRRLNSVKPRTRERAQEVAQLIADIQESLTAVDEMFGVLKEEHEQAIYEQWEDLKRRGREARIRVSELEGRYYTAMQNANASEMEKGRAKLGVDNEQQQRRSVYRDKFATQQRKDSADAKVTKAARELMAASDAALKGQQALGEAYNKWKLAQSELLGIEIGCDQCAAEIQGVAYHDPDSGLSTEVTLYQG